MFGFFKRKNVVQQSNPFTLADPRAERVVKFAVAALDVSVNLCRQYSGFSSTLHSDFVRGYLVGFFDAAAQAGELDLTDAQFITFLGIAHTALLEDDVPDPAGFALASIDLAGNQTYTEGMVAAVNEFSAWCKDREKPPFGLIAPFLDAGR